MLIFLCTTCATGPWHWQTGGKGMVRALAFPPRPVRQTATIWQTAPRTTGRHGATKLRMTREKNNHVLEKKNAENKQLHGCCVDPKSTSHTKPATPCIPQHHDPLHETPSASSNLLSDLQVRKKSTKHGQAEQLDWDNKATVFNLDINSYQHLSTVWVSSQMFVQAVPSSLHRLLLKTPRKSESRLFNPYHLSHWNQIEAVRLYTSVPFLAATSHHFTRHTLDDMFATHRSQRNDTLKPHDMHDMLHLPPPSKHTAHIRQICNIVRCEVSSGCGHGTISSISIIWSVTRGLKFCQRHVVTM